MINIMTLTPHKHPKYDCFCENAGFETNATKGATREGAEAPGAEAPPLAKSKLRKKTKYRIV